jgi:hypothetical protein
VRSLPDEVFCNKISFNMNYVDGKSLKNCDMCSLNEFEDYIRKAPKPHPIIMGKLPAIPRADQPNEDFQRYFEMKADVYVWIASKLGETIGKMISVKPVNRIGDFEGFEVYREGNSSWTDYVEIRATDGIQHVRCVAPPEKTHPENFCNANIVINDRLVAEVQFVDFRMHGGRRFLQERIRAFKKHICPILKCSSEALEAAKVVGGF